MKDSRMPPNTELKKEAQDRDAMIKAMLANIPCMSKETLAENRQKIEQNTVKPVEEKKLSDQK